MTHFFLLCFVRTFINEGKRSVSFYGYDGYDGDKKVPLGNVTIPPNHDIPQPKSIIQIRYLYCYRGGGEVVPSDI